MAVSIKNIQVLLLLIFIFFISNVHAQEITYDSLWNYSTGDDVYSVSISSDGSYLAAGSGDGNVYLFNKEGRSLWLYPTPNYVKEVSISSDGLYIAATSRALYLLNNEKIYLFGYDLKSTNAISISSNGSYLAVAGTDNTIYLFGKDEMSRPNFVKNLGDNVMTVSISSDGSQIVAGAGSNIYLYNKYGFLLIKYETGSIVPSVSFSPDAPYMSAASGNNIYFFREGKLLWKYTTKNGIVQVSVSSDGSNIAAASEKEIYLLNKEGTLLWNHPTDYPVADLKISSDGSRIAAAAGRNIYVFDKQGTLLLNNNMYYEILSISISFDGAYIAAGSKDDKVYFIAQNISKILATPSPTIESTVIETPSINEIPIPEQTFTNTENATVVPIKSTPFLSTALIIFIFLAIRSRSLR